MYDLELVEVIFVYSTGKTPLFMLYIRLNYLLRQI